MKIVIAGNYGAKNIGDEMILQGILKMLESVTPNAEITVLSGNPQETSRKFNVKSEKKVPSGIKSLLVSIFDFKSKTKKSIKECDFFILGGGGLFNNLTFKANIIWGIQALAAYYYKKPVIMYGQSIGKLSSRFTQYLVKKVFQKASFITVRDNDSQKRLKKLGLKKKIHVIPDMAFRKKEKDVSKKKNSKSIIVALRQMQNLSNDFQKAIVDFTNWLIKEKKWTVDFVNFQEGSESDQIIHKKIIASITDKSKTKITNDRQEIKKADLVLGMRLHSLISAIKAETPFIAISYAPKVKSLLKTANLNHHMLEMNEISTEKLKDLFIEIQKDPERISKKLQKYNKEAIKKHKQIEEIFKKEITLHNKY